MKTLLAIAALFVCAASLGAQCRPQFDPILGKMTCPITSGATGATGSTGVTGATGPIGGIVYGPFTVTAQTSVTVTAATHGAGTTAVPTVCLDGSSNAVAFNWSRNGSGDITYTFFPAFTGTCQISGAGSVSNPITGLTTGTIPKAASSTTLGDSVITTSGNSVIVNGSAALGDFLVSSALTTVPRGIVSGQFNTGTDSARLSGYKARGTQGSPTTVVTGDLVTRWSGWPYDGTNYLEAASIVFGTEGTIASTRTPTYIAFSTGTDAAPTVLTERMRITSGGLIEVGTTSQTGINTAMLSVVAPASSTYGLIVSQSDQTAGGFQFGNNSGVSGRYGPTLVNWIKGNTFTFASIQSVIDGSNDSGSQPVFTFDQRINGGAVTTRPLFAITNNNSAALVQIAANGNALFGGTTDGNYRLDVQKSGSTGTARFYDQTATTGSTLVTVTPGAAQTAASTVLSLGGVVKFAGTNSTGAGSALLGANSPASTLTAPYTWITVVTSDGSTAYIPAWK